MRSSSMLITSLLYILNVIYWKMVYLRILKEDSFIEQLTKGELKLLKELVKESKKSSGRFVNGLKYSDELVSLGNHGLILILTRNIEEDQFIQVLPQASVEVTLHDEALKSKTLGTLADVAKGIAGEAIPFIKPLLSKSEEQ